MLRLLMTMNGLLCSKRFVLSPIRCYVLTLVSPQNLIFPENLEDEGLLMTLVSQKYRMISEAGQYLSHHFIETGSHVL